MISKEHAGEEQFLLRQDFTNLLVTSKGNYGKWGVSRRLPMDLMNSNVNAFAYSVRFPGSVNPDLFLASTRDE